MIRTILGLVVGMALAFTGVLFFVWVLWWLWRRLGEQQAARIEIEAELPEPVDRTRIEAGIQEDLAAKVKEPLERPAAADDLKRIEGIGPKFSAVLQAAGIMTYDQLAAATPDELEQILEEEDPRLSRLADPTSWPEQAALAAGSEWESLKALQDTLKGGRRV